MGPLGRGIPRTWDSSGIHVTRDGPHVTRDSRGIVFPAPTRGILSTSLLVARGWLDCLVFSWVFNLACSSTTGFVHGFYDFCLQLLSPSPSLGQKKELVHDHEASYASEFLTLI